MMMMMKLILVIATISSVSAGALKNKVLEKLRTQAKAQRTWVHPNCENIYSQEMAIDFSPCQDEDNVDGQRGVDCSAYDSYDTCVPQEGCWWFHLNQNRPPACLANPCFRINNGQCTIQATGGRCVWYTAEQNSDRTGGALTNPGCYKSPCANPIENNPKGCRDSSDSAYQCIWCPKHNGQAYGCMNKLLTSTAQCWNIGGEGALPGCNSCTEEGETCTSETCAANCCQSPLCLCIPEEGRSPDDIAVDIGNYRRLFEEKNE